MEENDRRSSIKFCSVELAILLKLFIYNNRYDIKNNMASLMVIKIIFVSLHSEMQLI